MAKRDVKITTQNEKLDDAIARIDLFVGIVSESLANDPDNERLWGQVTAFGAVLTLLRQIRKRGESWKGGYLDNVGVVYTDQVKDFYESQVAGRHQDELDAELAERLR